MPSWLDARGTARKRPTSTSRETRDRVEAKGSRWTRCIAVLPIGFEGEGGGWVSELSYQVVKGRSMCRKVPSTEYSVPSAKEMPGFLLFSRCVFPYHYP